MMEAKVAGSLLGAKRLQKIWLKKDLLGRSFAYRGIQTSLTLGSVVGYGPLRH